MAKTVFTSESVTRGHPDKVCDQIADRILDRILVQDPDAHVACEVTACTDQVHIFGEITTDAKVDYEEIARLVIAEIGYTRPGKGFDAEHCRVTVDVHGQSPDIARGVRRQGAEEDILNAGAGDQGTMFGYACRQTSAMMPMPIELAHMLAKRLEHVRRSGELPYLLPDGKSQVSVEYDNGLPVRIAAVIVSAQHDEGIGVNELRDSVLTHVIRPALPSSMIDEKTQIFINPTGRFTVGGPAADAGLSGRKLIADTYGGYARCGGGSLSGKDASKVDRTGAYMARYLAKNIVAQGLAEKCEVQLSYAIGLADPVSVGLDTFGTGTVKNELILRALLKNTDLRPAAVSGLFGLTTPCFSRVSCYGHFGSNAANLAWERTDLKKLL